MTVTWDRVRARVLYAGLSVHGAVVIAVGERPCLACGGVGSIGRGQSVGVFGGVQGGRVLLVSPQIQGFCTLPIDVHVVLWELFFFCGHVFVIWRHNIVA